jgi:hypothetical protein
LIILINLLALAGSLVCCIGPMLLVPVNLAVNAVAYRRVFPDLGLDDPLRRYRPDELGPDQEGEPVPEVLPAPEAPSTGIQESRALGVEPHTPPSENAGI